MRALAACAVLPPLVSLVSLARIVSAMECLRRPPRRPGPDDAALAVYVVGILRRLPPPWRNTCLRRAVVLYYLLCQAGRRVALRIGVRRGAGGVLEAHAWLVRDGAPYLEADSARTATYAEITTFPSGGGA